jgi:hypothetical protein
LIGTFTSYSLNGGEAQRTVTLIGDVEEGLKAFVVAILTSRQAYSPYILSRLLEAEWEFTYYLISQELKYNSPEMTTVTLRDAKWTIKIL